jgi:hypothetical protein
LRRLAQSIWRPYRVRHARAMPLGWPKATVGLRPGINEIAASVPIMVPEPLSWVTYSLDLDIGEIALGHHLIVRSISLSAKDLLFESDFLPELADDAGEVWLNMYYDADIPFSNWDYIGCGWDIQYERPPLEARYAWFDFFRPDYEWMDHFDGPGQPDSDYLRNRIARLTFDLKTGEAQIER